MLAPPGHDPKSLTLRDRDHKALWRSEIALLAERHQARIEAASAQAKAYRDEVERLKEANSELREHIRNGFESAPLESVREWLISDAIKEANAERDRAFRSRAHAYRTLWAANTIHHHDPQRDERCSCGKPAPGCNALLAIENIEETLYRWERHQVQRLMDGKEHELPDDHPDVLARPGWERSRWRHYAS